MLSLKNKSLLWLYLIASAMLLRAPESLSAGREVMLSDDLLFRTGSAFQSEGEYYRAITEYKKLLIVFPESDRAEDAHFNIGMSYLKGEEYERAAATFQTLRRRFLKGPHVAQSRLYEGTSYRKLKKYREAVVQFDTVIYEFRHEEEAPKALLEKALIALELNELDEMKSELDRILREYPDHDIAQKARQSLALAQSFEQLPKKSTVLAGSMSAILPGSGYFYAGNYGDGLTAFFVNALFIAGTVTAVNQHNYPTAYIVGGFGLPFYIGNIYGSANAARKWNLAVRKDAADKIYSLLELHY
jgi:TolA-binding protein